MPLEYMIYWFVYTGVRSLSRKEIAPTHGLIELVELFLPLLVQLFFLSKQFCALIGFPF